MYTKNFVNPCPDWATALLNGFSQVLLLRNPLCGLCCLLAILLTAPNLVGGALLGALAGLRTAQARGYDRADRQAGLYCYNGVLIGILISAVLPWSAILPPLIIAADQVGCGQQNGQQAAQAAQGVAQQQHLAEAVE